MIVSFRDKRTRHFAVGKRIRAFAAFERSARLKLDRLEAATSLRDLSVLPGNRFETLRGDRQGQFSICVTMNGEFASSGPIARRAPRTLKLSTITRRPLCQSTPFTQANTSQKN